MDEHLNLEGSFDELKFIKRKNEFTIDFEKSSKFYEETFNKVIFNLKIGNLPEAFDEIQRMQVFSKLQKITIKILLAMNGELVDVEDIDDDSEFNIFNTSSN